MLNPISDMLSKASPGVLEDVEPSDPGVHPVVAGTVISAALAQLRGTGRLSVLVLTRVVHTHRHCHGVPLV